MTITSELPQKYRDYKMTKNNSTHTKQITIKQELLNAILNASVGFSYETGGFIGLRENQICYFMFDSGVRLNCMGRYYPNADSMRLFLENRRQDKLSGIGILHTHLCGDSSLSRGDVTYIYQIFHANPDLREMYFPVVVPGRKLCMYLAERQTDNILIKSVRIKIT